MARREKNAPKTTAGRASSTKKTNVAVKGQSAAGKSASVRKGSDSPKAAPRAQAAAAAPAKRPSRLKRAGNVVARTAKKITAKLTPRKRAASGNGDGAQEKTAKQKRVVRRETDVPMEALAATYTPSQTSLKTSFRSDGADRQRDQELARGVADQRWEDEDHYTNKSGDARIGTHGRTYEPGEARAATEK
jgi:hypothetical protein